jgi:hypothetical protein
MASDLEVWARTEWEFLRGDIKRFKTGTKLISPSGGDITEMKLIELELRLKHVQMVLADINGA